jgi:hypothetical protein
MVGSVMILALRAGLHIIEVLLGILEWYLATLYGAEQTGRMVTRGLPESASQIFSYKRPS